MKERYSESKTINEIKRDKNLASMGKISLWLDNYNELFSDFDPRPTAERSLSEDFLSEIKKATVEKGENIEMRLLIPRAARNIKEEALVNQRLRKHFRKHYESVKKEARATIFKGAKFIIAGILLMLTATYILITHPEGIFIWSFLVILLEPGGWFFFWEGLSLIVFDSREFVPDLNFYRKMSRTIIQFNSY